MAISTRYSRQFILPEIGEQGQRRIGAGKVLCIGAGGLGCAFLPYLAGAGVGQITIIEPDRVDRSNLQRQVLFGESDIGRPKASAAAQRLTNLNPDIDIRPIEARLEPGNAAELVAGHDVIIDGSDNFPTKYLAADASVRFGKPLVYGSVTGMEAMVSVFAANRGPCLRCLFPDAPKGWVPNCAEAGVLGPLVGMTGSLQASEAIKLLIGADSGLEPLIGRLWMMDARTGISRILSVKKQSDCPTCSKAPESIVLGSAGPQAPEEIDLETLHDLTDLPLFDVREPDEYAAGHIPGAINLPVSKLGTETSTCANSDHCVIYCETGLRCRAAAGLLQDIGYSRIYSLRGGMTAWRQDDKNRETGDHHGHPG